MSTIYPVDSATRLCCGGIGRHRRECATPPPPARGEPGEWEGDYRPVLATLGTVLDDRAVTAYCEQFRNGRIGVVDVAIGDHTMSTVQARELARLLTAAADLADGWVK